MSAAVLSMAMFLAYVVVVLGLYLRPVRPSESRPAPQEPTAVGA